jgi:hypothetical protein
MQTSRGQCQFGAVAVTMNRISTSSGRRGSGRTITTATTANADNTNGCGWGCCGCRLILRRK